MISRQQFDDIQTTIWWYPDNNPDNNLMISWQQSRQQSNLLCARSLRWMRHRAGFPRHNRTLRLENFKQTKKLDHCAGHLKHFEEYSWREHLFDRGQPWHQLGGQLARLLGNQVAHLFRNLWTIGHGWISNTKSETCLSDPTTSSRHCWGPSWNLHPAPQSFRGCRSHLGRSNK